MQMKQLILHQLLRELLLSFDLLTSLRKPKLLPLTTTSHKDQHNMFYIGLKSQKEELLQN